MDRTAAALRPEHDEAAVLALARAGDPDATRVLLAEHHTRLLAVATRLVDDPRDAEDVVQEAELRLWQQLPGFRGEARFATWAYRVVTNCAIDHLRRPRRERAVDVLPDRVEDTPDPASQLVLGQELDQVAAAMLQLSIEQRVVLVLAEVVGLDQAEVAVVLDTTVSGVKNRLYRARTRLQELLDERGDAPAQGRRATTSSSGSSSATSPSARRP